MNQTLEKKPYTFDISFDDQETLDSPQLISKREIENLKEEAFALGKQEGRTEMQNSIEAALNILLQTINAELLNIKEREEIYFNTTSAKLVQVTRKLMNKLFPAMQQTTILDEIIQKTEETITTIGNESSLTLSLHPDVYKQLQKHLSKNKTPLWKGLHIKEDAKLSLSDYTLSWPKGIIQKNQEALMAKVDTIIENVMAQLHPREEIELEEDGHQETMVKAASTDESEVSQKEDAPPTGENADEQDASNATDLEDSPEDNPPTQQPKEE